MFPKEMDAFIDDEDVGYLDALLDVPDFDVDSLFAAHVETEQEVQRHSRLIDDAVAEAQVEPADVRQFELSSIPSVFELAAATKSMKSPSVQDSTKSVTTTLRRSSLSKKTEIQRMRLTNGLEFSRTSVSPTATSVTEQQLKQRVKSNGHKCDLTTIEAKCKVENHFHVTVVKK